MPPKSQLRKFQQQSFDDDNSNVACFLTVAFFILFVLFIFGVATDVPERIRRNKDSITHKMVSELTYCLKDIAQFMNYIDKSKFNGRQNFFEELEKYMKKCQDHLALKIDFETDPVTNEVQDNVQSFTGICLIVVVSLFVISMIFRPATGRHSRASLQFLKKKNRKLSFNYRRSMRCMSSRRSDCIILELQLSIKS